MTLDALFTNTTTPGVRAGRYRLDPGLSSVHFSAKKFGLFTIRGTLALASGDCTVGQPLELSAVHAVLDAGSFTTPMAKRDAHVRGSRLLDAWSFPDIVFDSTEVVHGDDGWQVRGRLTVHGRGAPVTLSVSSVAAAGPLLRVQAGAVVDRRRFGVTAMRAAASSRIDVVMDVVGVPVDTD
jgi:polyisoprenoid-binding protein YceI